MTARTKVGVVGAGSWGTALAALLARENHEVVLWGYEEEAVAAIRNRRENPAYLPDIELPAGLKATTSLAEAVAGAEVVVSVSPAQHVGRVMAEAAPHMEPDVQVVSASKGIELGTLRRMDQVFRDLLTMDQMARFTVLSGPSFALEVANREPTAVVVASHGPDAALRAQHLFQTDRFRVYTNSDVVGVELGGALKNVIALAAGVVAGLGFGHNTRSALMTRGLAEITRLGTAMGASRSTFSGLAGMGDLVLTCTGELSRNRTVGFRLGQGESLEEIVADSTQVAEGIPTAAAAHALARRNDVEMPICSQVHDMLSQGCSPLEAVENLMLRAPKPEEWG
ncbi:MAG: NAD(P)H-dependent glycerol-3-phosphate dehydrogenase [Gemmatimonadota bacterium]